jgi:phosphoribosylformylglycinamidine synthase
MASDEFSAEGPSQRPTVQVGDPFMEKLLLEACLEIFAEDLLIGIQDMGAAGLTSSSVEMAGRSGSGLDLDLDLVPRRARGLTPYEMLLSESQERMLLVAKPGSEARVLEICAKWELDAAVIGRVTETGRWVIRATPGYDPLAAAPPPRDAVVVCDLPVDFLTEAAPKYDRPQADDPSLRGRLAFDPATIEDPPSWSEALLEMAGSPNLGSRRWVWRQYDHIVRGGTIVRPGGDAAVVRVLGETGGTRPQTILGDTEPAPKKNEIDIQKILAFAVDCNGRICELDPFQGAAMAVAEVCRNVACVGAEPVGLTDCLNFGSPERPEIMRQFARAIDGMAAACEALKVPIVSGNVSLYNETDGRAVLPTPTVAVVGLVRDEGDVVRSTFPESGLRVFLLGAALGGPLGGSEYVARRTGEIKGPIATIDLDLEARLQGLVIDLCRARPRLLESAHDVSEGGLAIALAEACVAGDDERGMIGAAIDLSEDETAAAALFGEAPSRIVISAASEAAAEIERLAAARGVGCFLLGTTGSDRLRISRGGAVLVDLELGALRDARQRALDVIVGPSA